MENGMGMLTGEPGAPMGDDYGPSLGRGIGVGSTHDRTYSNTALPQHDHMQGMSMGGEIAPDANRVPGFPQDAYMEGPMMAVKSVEEEPYNYGLRPGWSGFMQGMMTLVRVLPPDRYDQVIQRMRQGGVR